MIHAVYDKPVLVGYWPRWWESSDDPGFFGADCVICGGHFEHMKLHHSIKAIDMDVDNEFGSGFCVCQNCVNTWGTKPSAKNIDKHDRAVMRRYSAVYNRLVWEIMNGRRTNRWSAVGTLQP